MIVARGYPGGGRRDQDWRRVPRSRAWSDSRVRDQGCSRAVLVLALLHLHLHHFPGPPVDYLGLALACRGELGRGARARASRC